MPQETINIDPAWVGKEAAKMAVSALKTKSVETKSAKVILTQFALQELLAYTLINAIRADSVQRDSHRLKVKSGKKLLQKTSQFTMMDCLPGGLRTGAFDGEGVPHQKTTVIEKGMLRKVSSTTTTQHKKMAKKAQVTLQEQVTSQRQASTPQTSTSCRETKPAKKC